MHKLLQGAGRSLRRGEVTVEDLKKLFDDVTTDEDGHQWSQVCTKCEGEHKLPSHLLAEEGSGICGVKGCENEAEYYLDFETVPQEPILSPCGDCGQLPIITSHRRRERGTAAQCRLLPV